MNHRRVLISFMDICWLLSPHISPLFLSLATALSGQVLSNQSCWFHHVHYRYSYFISFREMLLPPLWKQYRTKRQVVPRRTSRLSNEFSCRMFFGELSVKATSGCEVQRSGEHNNLSLWTSITKPNWHLKLRHVGTVSSRRSNSSCCNTLSSERDFQFLKFCFVFWIVCSNTSTFCCSF